MFRRHPTAIGGIFRIREVGSAISAPCGEIKSSMWVVVDKQRTLQAVSRPYDINSRRSIAVHDVLDVVNVQGVNDPVWSPQKIKSIKVTRLAIVLEERTMPPIRRVLRNDCWSSDYQRFSRHAHVVNSRHRTTPQLPRLIEQKPPGSPHALARSPSLRSESRGGRRRPPLHDL